MVQVLRATTSKGRLGSCVRNNHSRQGSLRRRRRHTIRKAGWQAREGSAGRAAGVQKTRATLGLLVLQPSPTMF